METMVKGENLRKRRGKGLRWWHIPIVLLLLLVAAFLVYSFFYYAADETALSAMRSDETVSVTETSYGWLFDGPSEDTALIFYPGAKVEEMAYAPLLHQLAEEGMDVCLVRMPLRYAFFSPYAAGDVINTQDRYTEWYIGGHSLGGVFASWYAADHPDDFAGVILLASYPIKKLPDKMTEILLVGSEDKVIGWERLEIGRQFASSHYDEHFIEGGNHAQFGSYGSQRGDGIAGISAEEQRRETVDYIMQHIDDFIAVVIGN